MKTARKQEEDSEGRVLFLSATECAAEFAEALEQESPSTKQSSSIR